MERVDKLKTETGLRLQYELLVEPEVRKVLTLEQIFTVFRRTVLPETLTREDREAAEADTQGMLQGAGGERRYHVCSGDFQRAGRQVRYSMDDDLIYNEDGSLTAAFLWWETEREEPAVEAWFEELVRAVEEAQENLLLFGRI